MGKQAISPRQFTMLLLLSRMVPVTVGYPLLTATENPQDAWVAALAGAILSIPFVLAIVAICTRAPGVTVVQTAQELLGPLVGKVIGLVLALYWLMTAADVARALGESYVGGAMPETPLTVFVVVTAVMAAVTARSGIEVMGRMAEATVYLTLVLLLVTSLLSYDFMKGENLRPLLAGGIRPLVRPVSINIGFFLQFIVLGMTVPHTQPPERIRASALRSIFAGGLVLVWMSVGLVAVFGPRSSALFLPAYALGRVVSVGQFIERVEVIILSVLTVCSFLKTALFLWASAVALQQVFGLGESNCLLFPLASLTAVLGVLSFRTYVDFVTFFLRSWPIYSVLLVGAVIVVLSAASLLRSSARRETL